jgi:D-tyrosyl-tRNA(Tyr) deacylase
MRAVLQRVASAEVKVAGDLVGKINRGIMLLFGVHREDCIEDLKAIQDLAAKCAELRIFSDPEGKMNLSCAEVGGEALVVSQFTLYGDCRKGRRPNFMDAAEPEKARKIYEYFVEALRRRLGKVETGEFGAQMQIALVNDGPVTLVIEKSAGNWVLLTA